MTAPRRRTGRRPGPTNTRNEILHAGRKLFAERGFDGTSMRAIAAEADVDAALIGHYFGGKEGLFEAVMELPVDPVALAAQLTKAPLDELPAHLVATFLQVWEGPDTGPAMVSVMRRAIGDPAQLESLRSFMAGAVLGPVMPRLAHYGAPEQVHARLSLVASLLLGTMVTRHVLHLDPLHQMTRDDLAALLLPTVTHYLVDELPFDPAHLEGNPA